MSQPDIFEVELIEKEFVDVSLTTVDILPISSQRLQDLSDINLQNLLNQQYLRYNSATQKWENVTLNILIEENSVYNESPLKITATIFRASNNFIASSLQVFINGIKEKYITVLNNNEFQFLIDTVPTDIVEIHYVKQ